MGPFRKLWVIEPQGGATSIHHVRSHEKTITFLGGPLILVQIEGEELREVWSSIIHEDTS